MIYKVDTDAEHLYHRKTWKSKACRPYFLFRLMESHRLQSGALPKESVIKAINNVLLINKKISEA